MAIHVDPHLPGKVKVTTCSGNWTWNLWIVRRSLILLAMETLRGLANVRRSMVQVDAIKRLGLTWFLYCMRLYHCYIAYSHCLSLLHCLFSLLIIVTLLILIAYHCYIAYYQCLSLLRWLLALPVRLLHLLLSLLCLSFLLCMYVCMYAALVTHHSLPKSKLQRMRGCGEKCSRLHTLCLLIYDCLSLLHDYYYVLSLLHWLDISEEKKVIIIARKLIET